MQKLKKKSVLLLGIFLFSACGSVPKKPKIEICAHDEPVAEVECFDNQNNSYRTLPIGETDRYIMLSPDNWGLILVYVGQLESRIRRSTNQRHKNSNYVLIRKELKKVINTSKLHNEKNEKAGILLY